MNNQPAVTGVEDSFEKFLRLSVADGDARPRTVRAYREAIGYYAAWAGSVTVNPATAGHEQILAYRESLIAAGYARATIRLRLTAVRLFYRALARWGGRRDNPADGVRAPKEREGGASSVLAKAVSPEQAKALMALAGPGRDGIIVRLMLLHGVRVGEAAALTLDDLSPAGDRLSVPGKGGKRRTLVLSYRMRADLATVKPSRPAGSREPLFKRRGGGSMGVRSIQRAVNLALAAVGAKEPGRSCHSLRHAHAIMAVMGGAKQEALADEMGHNSLGTTFIYTRAAAALQEPPSDAVERALA